MLTVLARSKGRARSCPRLPRGSRTPSRRPGLSSGHAPPLWHRGGKDLRPTHRKDPTGTHHLRSRVKNDCQEPATSCSIPPPATQIGQEWHCSNLAVIISFCSPNVAVPGPNMRLASQLKPTWKLCTLQDLSYVHMHIYRYLPTYIYVHSVLCFQNKTI